MIRIGVIGLPTKDKSYLMLYLSKVLSMDHSVLVITNNQWFIPSLDSFEYSPSMTIAKKISDDSFDYCLVDALNIGDETFTHSIYVSDVDRWSVETNSDNFESSVEEENKIYIFMNVLLDGKINEKYLCQKFGLNTKSQSVYCQYLNDNDLAVNIENGYNERLDIKGLSRDYKKLLIELLSYCSDGSKKELKHQLKQAERNT